MRVARLIPWLAAALSLSDCLPADTRPTPASVLLTAEPSAAVTAGVATSDGWTVSFERLLMGVGDARLTTEACVDYENSGGFAATGYSRLFDFSLAGRREVSELYGLGSCGLRFRLSAPATDDLLSVGVTPADLAFMRIFADDGHAQPGARSSVYLKGHASRGGETKRFEWAFRRQLNAHDCGATTDGGVGPPTELVGGASLTFGIVVHGEELFRETADQGAPLTFDLLASADANGDGEITLLELSKVPAPPPLILFLDPARADDAGDGDAGDSGPHKGDGGTHAGDGGPAGDAGDGGLTAGAETLEDLVYDHLLTKVFTLGDAACTAEARGRGRGGGG